MDKKTLLAEATKKLERQQSSAPAPMPTPESDDTADGRVAPSTRAKPVVSKGITLRPTNVEKLDRLELSLRKQGIKAGHSGLIQIAIDLLEDNAQLAKAYRELLKLDLRLK